MENEGETTQGLIPVRDPGPDEPEEGVALCLSGGGYRAMLFHLGGIIRLNEMGHLQKIARVRASPADRSPRVCSGWPGSSSSSGSVVSPATSTSSWSSRFGSWQEDDRQPAIIWGLLLPWRTAPGMLASSYAKYLFGDTTLQDLPDDSKREGPRFVFNATNVQTGKLFRFSRPYQGDYSVGLWRDPSTRVADAVAASTAYPPTLSPSTPKPSGMFDESTEGSNKDEIFRKKLWLTDGGVYDNLGLETAWKRYRTLLVSDAGAPLGVDPQPHRNWIQHAIWVSDIVDDQVRALRKRQLIDCYERTVRTGRNGASAPTSRTTSSATPCPSRASASSAPRASRRASPRSTPPRRPT